LGGGGAAHGGQDEAVCSLGEPSGELCGEGGLADAADAVQHHAGQLGSHELGGPAALLGAAADELTRGTCQEGADAAGCLRGGDAGGVAVANRGLGGDHHGGSSLGEPGGEARGAGSGGGVGVAGGEGDEGGHGPGGDGLLDEGVWVEGPGVAVVVLEDEGTGR